jgi:RNA polymerase sigma factor (sigma-70 family)
VSETAARLDGQTALRPARLLSDERLVRRVAAGDERAFAAIYGRYHQRIYRYCLGMVGDSDDAQDALQNTMLKAMRALAGEPREIELKPWLYRIAHNESIDLVRRRRRTEQLDTEHPALAPQPAEDVQQRQRLRELLVDVEDLPERQRGALVMRELSGLDFEEIATVLRTSPPAVRQTLYEARRSLREMRAGRELSCDAVTQALSDGDGRVARRRDIRAHLRGCEGCRVFREEMRRRRADFAALTPLPGAVATGILQGLLGAHGSGGGGLAGALGAGTGAAKAVGTSAGVKAVATVAVVAAIGVTAADRGGLVHLGLPGDSRGTPSGSNSSPRTSGASLGGSGAAAAVGSRRAAAGGGVPVNVHEATATAARRAASGGGATPTASQPSEEASAKPTNPSESPGQEPSEAPGKAHGHETAAAKQTAHEVSGHSHGVGKGNAASGGHGVGKGQGGSRGHAPKPTTPAHPTKPAHPVPAGAGGNGKPAEAGAGQEERGSGAAQPPLAEEDPSPE